MIKFVSIEDKELESGQMAKVVTLDADGVLYERKIAYDTPKDKIDARIQDLAEGLAQELVKDSAEIAEAESIFKEGEVLIED